MKSISILFLLQFLALPCFAQEHSNTAEFNKIVEASFPGDLTSLRDSSGGPLTLQNRGLKYSYLQADFSKKGLERFLVVEYQARVAMTDIRCELLVIKVVGGHGQVMGATVLNSRDDISNCKKLSIENLDGGRVPQILLGLIDQKGYPLPPAIFKWNNNHLVEITPSITLEGSLVTAFRSLDITKYKIEKSALLIDTPDPTMSNDPSTKTYLMKDGKINLTGTFDFFQIIDKKTSDHVVTMNPSFPAAATYTLEVKNLSPHDRVVRAEVNVNGNVVLRPQDFCSAPPPNKTNKDAWKGNDDDDDDDKDEDHYKRCTPKKDVYAIVNLQTTNVIKVKLFGRGDSVSQFSLIKKP